MDGRGGISGMLVGWEAMGSLGMGMDECGRVELLRARFTAGGDVLRGAEMVSWVDRVG